MWSRNAAARDNLMLTDEEANQIAQNFRRVRGSISSRWINDLLTDRATWLRRHRGRTCVDGILSDGDAAAIAANHERLTDSPIATRWIEQLLEDRAVRIAQMRG